MSDVLPPIDELLAEFDSGKIPRSQTWHTLITGLYFNFDSVNEIENWYNTVQELTSFNQDLANKIQQNHDQVEIWYGEVDTWQQQVASHTQQAADSASAAEASETAAASSASTASTAASTATQQASAAEASATKAKASETASASSASQADSSATSAGSSATNALNSANKAKASETAAQQAASTAQTSEHNSEENAASAKASETAATTAASTATQQANRSESEADRSEAAAEKINREGIPIGSILPYYGSSAPMGWLGLTKGATISKADYPALYKHLTDQRKPATHTNQTFDVVNGQVQSGDATKNNTYMVTGNNVLQFGTIVGGYATLSVISGSMPSGSVTFVHYRSLIDIPLPNDECFLPDAANNFIKGYEPTGTREMGTFEQDAIRNITGKFGAVEWLNLNTEGIAYPIQESINCIYSSTSPRTTAKVGLDTSRVVPTGPENVPKNLNCLWIIKAYDAVSDPEQLQAKAVIDQVNKNSSEILSVTGTANRLDESTGYSLLDLGTVNHNTRYVQLNPFGNSTPVICKAEILIDGIWADPNAIFEYAAGGRGVMASYVESEGVIVRTAGVALNREPYSTCSAHKTNTIVNSAPCRVHVWRVKG